MAVEVRRTAAGLQLDLTGEWGMPEVEADREHGRKFSANPNAEWRVATGTAQDSGASSSQAHYRVVTRPDDWAIVH